MVRMPDENEMLITSARNLADAVEDALPVWVVGCVRNVLLASSREWTAETEAAAQEAGARACLEVGAQVRELLECDVDEQRATPLALLRRAVRYPTEVLHAAGVPPVERDAFALQSFPQDLYGLTPATWSDIDPSLHEPGLVWGAAKAFVHRQRHRPNAHE
jgi:hypothetical protein